jgi:putative membrane protein
VTKATVAALVEKSANELAAERTDLATRRTIMSADRTLMAWVRTALSMISFGFTIYKLLEGFQESGLALGRFQSPRMMGLFLTGLGTVSMLAGILEHSSALKEFREQKIVRVWRPTFVIALIMSLTGLFLFVSIIYRAL